MSTVEPLPIEISIPDIPPELSPEEIGIWIWPDIVTKARPDIPAEIEYPLVRPWRIPLRIRVGRNVFEVGLALKATEGLPVAES